MFTFTILKIAHLVSWGFHIYDFRLDDMHLYMLKLQIQFTDTLHAMRFASPLRSTWFGRFASLRRFASPLRRFASPLRLAASLRRFASPLRFAASLCCFASPLRFAASLRSFALHFRFAVLRRRFAVPLRFAAWLCCFASCRVTMPTASYAVCRHGST